MKAIIVEIILFVSTVIIVSLAIIATTQKGILTGAIFLALVGAFGLVANRISSSEKTDNHST